MGMKLAYIRNKIAILFIFNKGYSIFKGYLGGEDLKIICNAGVGGIK